MPSASVTQPKGKLPATHIPETHGRKTVDNYNRFPIKTLFGVAINCTQKRLLLLPLLSLFSFTSSSRQELPLHLWCCNFLKCLSFFPSLGSFLLLASSLLSVCSCSYQHSSLGLSLSPQSPLPTGGVPTIPLHTAVMVWGPGIHQNAEITFHFICENQVQDHPSRKEVTLNAIRYRAWIQPGKRYFSGPPTNTTFWCSYLRHTTPE